MKKLLSREGKHEGIEGPQIVKDLNPVILKKSRVHLGALSSNTY